MEIYENSDILEGVLDDIKSDVTLTDVDVEYIQECIKAQLENPIETREPKDFLKYFEKAMKDLEPEAANSSTANEAKNMLYDYITESILTKYKLSIDKLEFNNYQLCKTLYKFFVIHLAENIEMFIEEYIIDKQEDIVSELKASNDINTKHVEGVSTNIGLILLNMPEVIRIIANSDVQFDDFVRYVAKHPSSKGSAERLRDIYLDSIEFENETYNTIVEMLTDESEGFTTILTNVRYLIHSRFNPM